MRTVAVVAALAVVIGTRAGVMATTADAGSDPGSGTSSSRTVDFTSDGVFTIPDGVSTLQVTVVGAGGGASGTQSAPPTTGPAIGTGDATAGPGPSGFELHAGGSGNSVTATVDVTKLPARTMKVVVGRAGGTGRDGTGAGGAGLGAGGDGGADGSLGGPEHGAGGGGGSAILTGSTPVVVAGGGGGSTPEEFLAVGTCIMSAGSECSTTTTSSPPVPPSLPANCLVAATPGGHDGGTGSPVGSDGRYHYFAGGGGGGGWIGGAGGHPTVWQASPGSSEVVSCTGNGQPGTDHVDPAFASLVQVTTGDDSGADGRVEISFDGSKVAATSSVPSPTPAPGGASPATPVAGEPRYTG